MFTSIGLGVYKYRTRCLQVDFHLVSECCQTTGTRGIKMLCNCGCKWLFYFLTLEGA